MSLKNTMTNEKLNQRFDNPFALVNYAIKLAKEMVLRGEGLESNPANDALEIVAKGMDISYDEDDEEDEECECEETLESA